MGNLVVAHHCQAKRDAFPLITASDMDLMIMEPATEVAVIVLIVLVVNSVQLWV
jgi:hypothetical protein